MHRRWCRRIAMEARNKPQLFKGVVRALERSGLLLQYSRLLVGANLVRVGGCKREKSGSSGFLERTTPHFRGNSPPATAHPHSRPLHMFHAAGTFSQQQPWCSECNRAAGCDVAAKHGGAEGKKCTCTVVPSSAYRKGEKGFFDWASSGSPQMFHHWPPAGSATKRADQFFFDLFFFFLVVCVLQKQTEKNQPGKLTRLLPRKSIAHSPCQTCSPCTRHALHEPGLGRFGSEVWDRKERPIRRRLQLVTRDQPRLRPARGTRLA